MTATDYMPQAPATIVHAKAIEALELGLCVLPVSRDGYKRPDVESWRPYQTVHPSRAQVDEWFGDGRPGVGLLCGRISNGLEMFELEGRAVDDGLGDRFGAACDAAGIGDLLTRLLNGYSEYTPSNGLHILMHVIDGPCLKNTVLARRRNEQTSAIEILMETRGEGGFTIIAPSGGNTHPTGLSWELAHGSLATIARVTVAERDALYAVARSFDQMPAKVEVLPTGPKTVKAYAADGESWISDLCRQLDTEPWGDILGRYGFQHHHDAGSITYWTRPGKDTAAGYSATTNAKGTDRLICFSSSLPFDAWDGVGAATSYDRLGVIAAFDHHGDRVAAARHLTGRDKPSMPLAPARIDTATGEIIADTPYGEAFWTARPVLSQIRQAALSRMVAPSAVLLATLARVAAFTPPSTCLPAIIGSTSPLSIYVALYAPSGGGKSSALGCAADLLPGTPAGCIGPLGVGSGEGIVDAYFEYVDELDDAGKKVRVKRQTRYGALFNLDEGQALTEMGSRRGSTILPIMRTAWSGSDLGQANASQETRRILPAGSYSIGLVSGWQTQAAARLMEDADGGTPQRVVWASTIDPTISTTPPEWPGVISWTPPPLMRMGTVVSRNPLTVHPDIVAGIRAHHVQVQTGATTIDPLDAHRRLATLKIAGLFAVLDGRNDIDLDDWALAQRVMEASGSIRSWIVAEARREASQRDESSANRQARREAVVEARAIERALEQAAKAVQRVAAKGEPIKRRDVNQAMTSRTRQVVTVDEAIAEAVRRGWITPDGDGAWRASTTKSA